MFLSISEKDKNTSVSAQITNIKLIEATSQLNANYVYLNNSSTIFETKKVGGFSLKINLDVMILNYVKVINIIMIKSMKN